MRYSIKFTNIRAGKFGIQVPFSNHLAFSLCVESLQLKPRISVFSNQMKSTVSVSLGGDVGLGEVVIGEHLSLVLVD